MEKRENLVPQNYREIAGCVFANMAVHPDICNELCPFSDTCTIKKNFPFNGANGK